MGIKDKGKKENRMTLFGKLKNKCRTVYANYEEKRARRDIIFTETITPAPPEKPPVLVRGGIDVQLLLTVMALLVFGAIMCFSASNVYASAEYDDSMYFFKRYILYAALSIAVTALLVVFVKPTHLRLAAVRDRKALSCSDALVLYVALRKGDKIGSRSRRKLPKGCFGTVYHHRNNHRSRYA